MKKLLLAIVLTGVSTGALADMVCTQPKTCNRILSAGYSTGSAHVNAAYVSVTCLNDDAGVTIYNYHIVSLKGAIGLNRVSIPQKIRFEKGQKDTLDCK